MQKLWTTGKFVFEKTKKEKESRKNSKALELKELRISPNIAENDLIVKIKNAKRFLSDGHSVKFTMRFRGREIVKSEIGKSILDKISNDLSDISDITKKPAMEGRAMYMILSKKK